ncbi:MAG TPA: HAD-IIB family hydrolase [bacterium]|nr:HAD-IIB family hydrolase [bacterium]HPL95405.1 HAD-IIB family hydrolase [bacterium]
MNKINQSLESLKLSTIKQNIKAVTFDVDGVIVPTGTYLRENMAGTELLVKTHELSPNMIKKINQLKKDVWINIASGRSLLYLQNMLSDILWNNVSLIAENGNFILLNGQVQQLFSYKQKYFQKLTNIRQDLKKLKIKNNKICGFEPKHLIITIHTKRPVPAIIKIVKKHDPEKELYCLWTSEGYDIGHKKANKMVALKFLTKTLKIKPEQMLTTGNNLNDKEMLQYGVGVSMNPEKVSAKYAILPKKGQLGGEILVDYLLKAYNNKEL